MQRINSAEIPIRTCKKHFIEGLWGGQNVPHTPMVPPNKTSTDQTEPPASRNIKTKTITTNSNEENL